MSIFQKCFKNKNKICYPHNPCHVRAIQLCCLWFRSLIMLVTGTAAQAMGQRAWFNRGGKWKKFYSPSNTPPIPVPTNRPNSDRVKCATVCGVLRISDATRNWEAKNYRCFVPWLSGLPLRKYSATDADEMNGRRSSIQTHRQSDIFWASRHPVLLLWGLFCGVETKHF